MPSLARAQDAPPTPELTPEEQRAAALYAEGDRRYAEGRYEESVDLFKQAYAISPAPLLLYNLTNSYERLGAYAEAADALARYIDSGDAEDADTLRQRLRQIRKRAAARASSEAALAELRARPRACPPDRPCEVEPRPTSRSDTVAYVLFAGGGAMLVAAAVFGATASSAGDDARAACSDRGGVMLCSADAKEALDRQTRFALFTDVSVGASIAAIGVGTYFYLRHRKQREREQATAATVAPSLLRGGLGVTVGGRF